jgi:glyoxylase-like metal-dependent hydrolase (beta-lactamase superfamily II)
MYICVTCGTEFAGDSRPGRCAICDEERQYVGLNGQQWTTLEELRHGHHNQFIELEPGLTAILTEPRFGIGQRALLVQSPGGNVLWDCVALLDAATVQYIRDRGGLRAIAISHPHYYTTMVEWSRAFGDVPVYLHSADREWVMRSDKCLRFWDRETTALHDGMTLIRAGGHFAGGTVLHWPAGATKKGALLSGDIIQVVPDRRWVSFMYSYPNLIPLNAATVRRVVASVEPFAFDRVYGAFHPMQVMSDGKGAVRRSAERYVRMISP